MQRDIHTRAPPYALRLLGPPMSAVAVAFGYVRVWVEAVSSLLKARPIFECFAIIFAINFAII